MLCVSYFFTNLFKFQNFLYCFLFLGRPDLLSELFQNFMQTIFRQVFRVLVENDDQKNLVFLRVLHLKINLCWRQRQKAPLKNSKGQSAKNRYIKVLQRGEPLSRQVVEFFRLGEHDLPRNPKSAGVSGLKE